MSLTPAPGYDPGMSCEHEDCGLLCDRAILAERLAWRQAGGQCRWLTVDHVRAEGLRAIRTGRAIALLRAGGLTRQEVARRSGLGHQAVGRLAEAIGAAVVQAPSAVDEDETRRIEALAANGCSQRQIAAELGVSKSAVSRRLSRMRRTEQADCYLRS